MKTHFPFKELKKIKVPTIIIHGDNDSLIPFADSRKYIGMIQGSHELITIHGGDHGFHEQPYSELVTNSTVEFFKKYLW